MKSFTTRIELKGVSDMTTYNLLHKEMDNQGFSRYITSDDGVKYNLPNAEYNISGNFDRLSVLEKAKVAVGNIGVSGSILVTESNGRTWNNLDSVK